jgi:hypothetical protein
MSIVGGREWGYNSISDFRNPLWRGQGFGERILNGRRKANYWFFTGS